MSATSCPWCHETPHPMPPGDVPLCESCVLDGVGTCDACGDLTDTNEAERLGYLLIEQRVCSACVAKQAASYDATDFHEALTRLTGFMLEHGNSAETIVAAVEKPWKWRNEWALAVLVDKLLEEKRRAEAVKVRDFVALNEALAAGRPL